MALSHDIQRCLKSGGKLALAGILTTKQDLVLDAFSSLQVIRKKEEGDWISLWFQK